jgi:hypothetical protein
MHGEQKAKKPSIQWIFEKCNDSSEHYSDNALLYQYIILYAIELNNEFPTNGVYKSFTIWQLTGWLIDNYHKYRNEMTEFRYKNMTRNNRIAAKLDGVENKVNSLKILDLVEEKGMKKASRGEKQTMDLSFTHSGYLLAWIIESIDNKKREISNNQIYKVLEYNYKDRSTSFDNFALRMTEKYRSLSLFEEFVISTLRDRVNDPKWHIDNMPELIDSLIIPDYRKASQFYNIWLESLNELEEDQRNVVMQYVKLNIGRIIEKDVKYLRGYEERQYKLRDKPHMLAVEVVCNNRNCNRPSSLPMNLIDYIKIEKSPYTPSGMTCPWCGSSNTLSISLPY